MGGGESRVRKAANCEKNGEREGLSKAPFIAVGHTGGEERKSGTNFMPAWGRRIPGKTRLLGSYKDDAARGGETRHPESSAKKKNTAG